MVKIPTYDEILDVSLVSYTKMAEEGEMALEGIDDSIIELIAWCARVSNPTSQLAAENSEKLVKYLIKHKHWSPLEMVDVTLKIKTCRDISHQAVRHVTFRPQEFSQRYSNLIEMGEGFCTREARLQDNENRQNSIDGASAEIRAEWTKRQEEVIKFCKEQYEWAINNGLAKECARVVLPEGNTTTTYFFKGSIRSWIHYIDLRGANGTQKEHMLVAKCCAEAIAKVFPEIRKFVGE